MIYEFHCDGCGEDREVIRPMAEAGRSEHCVVCEGREMRRIFSSRYNCDELRSTSYVDRQGHSRKDHGRVFDMGLGASYTTWSERKKIMNAKGLREYGGPTREV